MPRRSTVPPSRSAARRASAAPPPNPPGGSSPPRRARRRPCRRARAARADRSARSRPASLRTPSAEMATGARAQTRRARKTPPASREVDRVAPRHHGEHRALENPGHVRGLLPPAVGLDSRVRGVRRVGVALRGLPLVKLVAFFALAVFVHGPLSPFLPTAFEATLLYYARFYPPWLLALVGTAGASLAEAVNYRLVDWAAELPKLAALRTGKAARWSVAAFLRAPFWTTVLRSEEHTS